MYGGLDHYMGANEIFENFIRAGPLPVWTERDRDGMKWRKNDSKDSTVEAKTRDSGVTQGTQRTGYPAVEDCSQVLKSNRICLLACEFAVDQ